MSTPLQDLIRPPVVLPPRIVILGSEGVGKTTLAAAAPSPVFVGREDGLPPKLRHLPHVPIREWSDFANALASVRDTPHDFRTLVIDTADDLTRLLETHVADAAKVETIEDIGGGFGKGDRRVAEEWTRRVLPTLNAIREERGMIIILLCHAEALTIKNPEGNDYSQTDLRLPKKVAAPLREWADAVLLADWEVRVATASREPKVGEKGKMTLGKRVLATERGSGWMAKNRYEMPPELPLTWEAIAKYLPVFSTGTGQRSAADKLRDVKARLMTLAEEIGGATLDSVRKAVGNRSNTLEWFEAQATRLDAKLVERDEARAKEQPAEDGRQPGEEG